MAQQSLLGGARNAPWPFLWVIAIAVLVIWVGIGVLIIAADEGKRALRVKRDIIETEWGRGPFRWTRKHVLTHLDRFRVVLRQRTFCQSAPPEFLVRSDRLIIAEDLTLAEATRLRNALAEFAPDLAGPHDIAYA